MSSVMSRKLLEMAAEIVQAQASRSKMSPEEIEFALTRTFNALQKMQKAEDEGTVLSSRSIEEEVLSEKKTDPKASIQESKIICLECGAEMKQLTTNHLSTHDLTPRQYKKKYGFPLKQPLSARSLTRSRSKAAKKRGVPPELKAFQEERRRMKEQMEGMVTETRISDLSFSNKSEPQAVLPLVAVPSEPLEESWEVERRKKKRSKQSSK